MGVHKHHTGGEKARRSERYKSILMLLFSGRIFCPSSRVVARHLQLGQDRPSPEGCIFRDLVQGKAQDQNFKVIAEDDKAVVIFDKFPAAEVHLLVLPREPIRSVLSLRADNADLELLDHMLAMGREALRRVNAPGPEDKWMFAFHIPPMTSIDHLHMHCIAGRFTNKGDMKFKYNYHYLISTVDLREKIVEMLER
jgi:diadenosine tetraphosphate (Ap4A) HIT family hydrolase